jgi:DNA adenine methylase
VSAPAVEPIKPLVPYHGGKSRLASWIVSLMPAHRVYVEPFAGSAAVLLAKPISTHEILNDVDGNVVNFYRVLRDRPEDLEYACRLSPYARDEFAQADLAEDLDDLERARRWWVRTNQSFAHTGTKATGWSTSIKRGSNNARTVWNRIERFSAAVDRLGLVTIENRDANEVIERYSAPDGVIYADPPYLMTSRSDAGRRRPGGDYAHEYGAEKDHRDLAEALHASSSTVLLSGYHSPLYDELYGDWVAIQKTVLRRSSNGRSATQVHVDEVVWCNRPFPEVLGAQL